MAKNQVIPKETQQLLGSKKYFQVGIAQVKSNSQYDHHLFDEYKLRSRTHTRAFFSLANDENEQLIVTGNDLKCGYIRIK